MKVYKYRPLSDFLFKELLYNEIYFASYDELNDPLDLSARIEFTLEKEDQAKYLLNFILRQSIDFFTEDDTEVENSQEVLKLLKEPSVIRKLEAQLFQELRNLKARQERIWIDDLTPIIDKLFRRDQFGFTISTLRFERELERLSKKFLGNSYASCFSARNDNFLMWSHYASKHSGVCLEFELTNDNKFRYEIMWQRNLDAKDFQEFEIKGNTYADRIHKVSYLQEQPFINFFDFSYAFGNEYHVDLIRLSKTWAHKYAFMLEVAFSTKTIDWKYEQEFRLIQINFDNKKEPENRIRHFPIEALTAIYFGHRTPEQTKNRVFRLLHDKSEKIEFYESRLTGGDKLNFEEWYLEEEE